MGQAALELEDQRAHPRVVLQTAVNLTSDTNFYTGLTNDISAGGVFVATYGVQPLGTRLRLELSLPDGGPPLSVDGEVRWVREYNPLSDGHPGMGLSFTHLRRRDQRRIAAFIAQRDTLFFDE